MKKKSRKREGKEDKSRGIMITLCVASTFSGGLKPKAVAGGPSVTRLTHNKCSGVNGSGRPNNVANNTVTI